MLLLATHISKIMIPVSSELLLYIFYQRDDNKKIIFENINIISTFYLSCCGVQLLYTSSDRDDLPECT